MDDSEYFQKIKSYPDSELESIIRGINKEQYPERYQAVLDELSLRKIDAEKTEHISTSSSNVVSQAYPPWSTDIVIELIFGVFCLFYIIDFFLALIIGFGSGVSEALKFVAENLSDRRSVTFQVYIVLRQFILDFVTFYFLYNYVRYFKLSFREGLKLQKIKLIQILSMTLCGLILALFFVILLRTDQSETPIKRWFSTPPAILLFILGGISFGPFVEEFFWRGFVYPALEKSRGVYFAIIVTTVAFGAVHMPQLWGAWTKILVIFILSLVLTSIRAITKSTTMSIVCHWSYNFSLFAFSIVKF